MKVLIAVDNSGCSRRAVEWVAKSNWITGTIFKVLGIADTEEKESELEHDVTRAVEGDCQYLELYLGSYHIEHGLTFGKPVDEIVLQAELWGAELIVVGSLGRDEDGSVLRASGSETILPGAPCPVVVVKDRKFKASAASVSSIKLKNISAAG